jgi:hypothetical protein
VADGPVVQLHDALGQTGELRLTVDQRLNLRALSLDFRSCLDVINVSACRLSVIYVSLLAHKSLLYVCNVTLYYCFKLVDFKVVVLLSFLNFYFNGL